MARLCGPTPELRPLSRAHVAAVLILLGTASSSAAQNAPVTGDPRAYATGEIGATWLGGELIPQLGGGLALRLGPRIEIGGAARFGLGRPTVVRQGSRVRLHFGYAGLNVGLWPMPERRPGLRLGVLVGGGSATVEDPGIGSLLDSDNGTVVEPSAAYGMRLGERISSSASVSWRFASGFALLGRVRSRDLRGPSVGVTISLGPF